MGIRSLNYIALEPGVDLPASVTRYLNEETAEISRDKRGTLIVYESNFTPMHARSGRGENCTFDLDMEVAIQRFLGTLNDSQFFMRRCGDECDYRGAWDAEAFQDHSDVKSIEAETRAAFEPVDFSIQTARDVVEFQRVADNLLQKHYGITINDTSLHDATYVSALLAADVKAFEHINEHAADSDLVRIDKQGSWGEECKDPLTLVDEKNARARIFLAAVIPSGAARPAGGLAI